MHHIKLRLEWSALKYTDHSDYQTLFLSCILAPTTFTHLSHACIYNTHFFSLVQHIAQEFKKLFISYLIILPFIQLRITEELLVSSGRRIEESHPSSFCKQTGELNRNFKLQNYLQNRPPVLRGHLTRNSPPKPGTAIHIYGLCFSDVKINKWQYSY